MSSSSLSEHEAGKELFAKLFQKDIDTVETTLLRKFEDLKSLRKASKLQSSQLEHWQEQVKLVRGAKESVPRRSFVGQLRA